MVFAFMNMLYVHEDDNVIDRYLQAAAVHVHMQARG